MMWTMPPEWAPHERTWMAWPTSGYTIGDTAEAAEEARRTWAAVANAIVAFEPVTMVVDPRDVDTAPRYLAAEVETLVAPLNDAWMRDIGPTFVVAEGLDGPRLGAVDWVFNGWGAQDWAEWDLDRHIGRIVAEAAGAYRIVSNLVNEGGGIHVDGTGTTLATTTVQLDPTRNPGLAARAVEEEFERTLGSMRTVWLPRGLTRDAERFGTRGHVDIVAAFSESGALLVHDQQDDSHPDAAVCREVIAALENQSHADGRSFDIVRVPAPKTLRDDEGWVDYSYINHLVVNGGVIACAFGDERDDVAAAILSAAYPGRRVVQIDARPLFARGGGIHCITQQQPAV